MDTQPSLVIEESNVAVRYTDIEIEGFIREWKPLPENYPLRLKLRQKRGHRERELDITGERGNQFRLILRESCHNCLDFSAILALCPRGTTEVFLLRRYNGKNHEHTNRL